jgi:hypothetical protein
VNNYWQGAQEQRVARRRVLAAGGAGAAALAFLAACGGDSSSGTPSDANSLVSKPVDTSKQARRGGVSKWFVPSEPSHLDVQIVLNPLSPMKNFVYNNLVQYEPGYLRRPTTATSCRTWRSPGSGRRTSFSSRSRSARVSSGTTSRR